MHVRIDTRELWVMWRYKIYMQYNLNRVFSLPLMYSTINNEWRFFHCVSLTHNQIFAATLCKQRTAERNRTNCFDALRAPSCARVGNTMYVVSGVRTPIIGNPKFSIACDFVRSNSFANNVFQLFRLQFTNTSTSIPFFVHLHCGPSSVDPIFVYILNNIVAKAYYMFRFSVASVGPL